MTSLQTKSPPTASLPRRSVAFCVLENGSEVALLFPHVNQISRIRARSVPPATTFRGQKVPLLIHLETPAGIVVLDSLPAPVQDALSSPKGVLLVGVDSLSRPVFEQRLVAGTEVQLSIVSQNNV